MKRTNNRDWSRRQKEITDSTYKANKKLKLNSVRSWAAVKVYNSQPVPLCNNQFRSQNNENVMLSSMFARHTNLRENSVALVFQIRAIGKARMTGSQIGNAEEYQVNKIKNVMKEMLAID